MAKWLRSGLRRDICVVVASEGSPTAQECKAAIESRYNERLDPATFYGALEALADGGHLAKTADGLHDRYELTDGGREAMTGHYDWVESSLSD